MATEFEFRKFHKQNMTINSLSDNKKLFDKTYQSYHKISFLNLIAATMKICKRFVKFLPVTLSVDRGMLGILLTVLTVVWCSFSSSKLFVSALSMENQQPLVAYPCGLVYGVFALLTVF